MTILSSNCPPRPLHPTFIVLCYINMDDAKTNSPEIQTTEAGTPKPPVITTIETNQQAHIKWCKDEAGRINQLSLAKKADLPTEAYSEPITQPEEAKKWDQLHNLSS